MQDSFLAREGFGAYPDRMSKTPPFIEVQLDDSLDTSTKQGTSMSLPHAILHRLEVMAKAAAATHTAGLSWSRC